MIKVQRCLGGKKPAGRGVVIGWGGTKGGPGRGIKGTSKRSAKACRPSPEERGEEREKRKKILPDPATKTQKPPVPIPVFDRPMKKEAPDRPNGKKPEGEGSPEERPSSSPKEKIIGETTSLSHERAQKRGSGSLGEATVPR